MRLREFDGELEEEEEDRRLSRKWGQEVGSFVRRELEEEVLNEIRGGLRLEGSEALR